MNAPTLSPEARARVARPLFAEMRPITDRNQWLGWRHADVTASEAGALLGEHEYQTAFGLWASKSGHVIDSDCDNGALERGLELEPVAINVMRRRYPSWIIRYPVGEYYRDPKARLGATPDAFANDAERDGFGIVQVKSVEASVFRRKWVDPETGAVEPPLWIACQAILEAHLTGASWACVAVIVCSHTIQLHVIDIPLHAGIIDRLRAEAADFWRQVDAGRPPEPDWKRDGRLLERLYDPDGEEIDLSGDNRVVELVDRKGVLAEQAKAVEAEQKAIKAELLTKLGGASAARLADGRLITAKRVERAAYQAKASSFLDVRIRPASRNGARP